MKKKLSKAESIARANARQIRKLRDEIDEMCESLAEMHETFVDIAYLLAPVIYDVRTKGKYPHKGVRRVADLIRKNERGDTTKLERAFWTGEEVD